MLALGTLHAIYITDIFVKMASQLTTSFPGSLFSASLSRWNIDPGCGWSRDHLSIQNRRVGGYLSTFGREDDKIPHPSSRFFYHPDSGWSRDQPQPGSLFQQLREAEKRDPGNEVAQQRHCNSIDAILPRCSGLVVNQNNWHVFILLYY